VVKPADFIPEDSPDLEQHLDGLGLILLQKAVPHQRPSRWISPTLIDSALRHLDEVGVGRETRAVMIERAATLEALGITRATQDGPGDGWERLFRQPLPVRHAAWQGKGWTWAFAPPSRPSRSGPSSATATSAPCWARWPSSRAGPMPPSWPPTWTRWPNAAPGATRRRWTRCCRACRPNACGRRAWPS
jgi:hypothetical protein